MTHNAKYQVPEKLNSIRCLKTADYVKPKIDFLLTLARLYEANPRHRVFSLDDTLKAAFTRVAAEFFPGSAYQSILIEYPFIILQTDGIWFLDIKEGKEALFHKYAAHPHEVNVSPARGNVMWAFRNSSTKICASREQC